MRSTYEMFQELNVAHGTIIKLVDTYQDKFRQLGGLTREQMPTSGHPRPYYMLNDKQINFLTVLMKNSGIIVERKLRIINDGTDSKT